MNRLVGALAAGLVLAGCQNTGDAPSGDASRGQSESDFPAPPPPPPPPAPPPPPPSLSTVTVTAAKRDRSAGRSVREAAPVSPQALPQPPAGDIDRERYEDVEVNPVKLVSEAPVSTFSIDVDTASYAVVRRYLNDGVLPPKDAVRIEELINYFDYAYALPEDGDDPFSLHVAMAPSPWAEGRSLLRLAVQGYDLEPETRPPLNLTLLVDVSGSMGSPDKLPLAKKALGLLIDELTARDTVSIAVYAGAAGEVLAPTPGDEKGKILAALEAMNAGGSTAGGEGLRLAYALAERGFQEDGVNRVMLLTDGDFNVGIADPERLEDFVSRKRDSGVYLSVMGFGRGNYNDLLMQKIAQTGNGIAGYVDSLNEARKLLSDDVSGNLFPIADDVKIQVEFNPAQIAEYRLIGYETRILDRADFNNDAVDAGDIGAGASVTALYEVTPVGSDARLIDESRYSAPAETGDAGNEIAFFKLRYKAPGAEESVLMTRAVTLDDAVETLGEGDAPLRFATAVAGYGQLLRGDPYLSQDFDFDSVIDLAQTARGEDPFGYRAEFIQLARAAKSAAAQAALEGGTGSGN